MQRSLRFAPASSRVLVVFLLVMLLLPLANPQLAAAASLDTDADRVLGQPNFTTAAAGTTATKLFNPSGAVVDPATGRIFVADFTNNRVLSWPDAASFTNGQAADIVIGQPNFTTGTALSPPTASSLKNPIGLALGPGPVLWVGDASNNRIVGYPAPFTTGMAATIVLGQTNFTNNLPNRGLAAPTAATLSNARGLAVDAQGNLYVADGQNSRVLMYEAPITSGENAALVLGQPGFTTATVVAPPTAASLNKPSGVAIDSSGNAYVTDSLNHRVLIYNAPLANGMNANTVLGQTNVTNNAINEGAVNPTASSLYQPYGLTLDANRNLYVADFNNYRVLRYAPDFTNHEAAVQVFGQLGSFTTRDANKPNPPGTATASNLFSPIGVATDAQRNLYVADFNNNRLLGYDLPVNNPAPAITSLFPDTVAAGGADYLMTVVGTGFIPDSVVRVNGVDRTTTYVSPSVLKAPILASDIAAPGISIQVTVFNPTPGGSTAAAAQVTTYARVAGDTTADGELGQPGFTTNLPNNGGISARGFLGPAGVAVRTSTGRLFVADTANSRVLSWPSAADFTNGTDADIIIGQTSPYGHLPNQGNLVSPADRTLAVPYGVAVSSDGQLAIADTGNHRVLIYTSTYTTNMAASFVLGQNDFTSKLPNQGGGSAGQATLSNPYGVAFDSLGNLWVSDYSNNRVLRFDAPFTNGKLASIVLGQPDFSTNTALTPPTASSLKQTRGLEVAPDGWLWVADSGNHRVLGYEAPFTNGKAASIVLGQPNFTTNAAVVPPTASSLNFPFDVAVDNTNYVYVADYVNNRVLVYTSTLASGMAANHVIGQPDFTTNTAGTTNARLGGPASLALDSQRNLYTAEWLNHRLLRFDTPIPNPVPGPITISPNTAIAGSPGFTMTITGTNFIPSSAARWQGITRTTTYISPTMLTAQIPVSDIVSGGVYSVTVFNPAPGGGTSPAAPFTVTNPVPSITSYSPNPIPAGSAITVTITGSGFVSGTMALWNGSPKPTTVLSATEIQVSLGASDVLTPGLNTLAVLNGGPGGGTSTPISATVSTRTWFIGTAFMRTTQ